MRPCHSDAVTVPRRGDISLRKLTFRRVFLSQRWPPFIHPHVFQHPRARPGLGSDFRIASGAGVYSVTPPVGQERVSVLARVSLAVGYGRGG